MKRITTSIVVAVVALLAWVPQARAQDADSSGTVSRPAFVRAGIYDKPFMTQFGRARIGGYLDGQFRYSRAEGVLDEASFVLERLNLFLFTAISTRLRFAAEIEFEEGGEEVKIELAILDFEIHEALTFRGGMILVPLGRFNLAHDSPANQLVDRPLVSTRMLGVTLSEPGMGFLGAIFPTRRTRLTYEAYLVNGFNEGVLAGGPEGTFIPNGKPNLEDNNNHPSFVTRVAVSPLLGVEIGGSAYKGPYNTYLVEGLPVDDRRDVTIYALDWEMRWRGVTFMGEYASAAIEIPDNLVGLFAQNQLGAYGELNLEVLRGFFSELPHSSFNLSGRYDIIDLNSDIDGDTHQRMTIGVNFRPVPESAFKLDYQFDWLRDGFDNPASVARIVFGVATYF